MNIEEHDLFNTTDQRRLKVYFVEIDDNNRERVISAIVQSAGFKVNNEFDSIYCEDYKSPLRSYVTHQTAELDLKLVTSEDGTLFKWEDWSDD